MLTVDQTTARLRTADPARHLPGYDEASSAALIAAATDPRAPRAWPAPANRRGLRRGVTLGLAAAGTAVALTLGPALVDVVTGSSSGAAPAAAQLLTRAADISVSDDPARPEQWYRITARNVGVTTEAGDRDGQQVRIGWRTSRQRTDYVAVDGARPTYVVEAATADPVQVFGPAATAPAEWRTRTPDVWTSNLAPIDIPASWQAPTPSWLAALPRDPAALRARMYADAAGHGPSTDTDGLVLAADVLRSGLAPSELRAVLYRVLRTVPGVTITSESATLDGRTGVGIGRSEDRNGLRQEIVIDPATGQVIGERTLVTRQTADLPLPVGTVFHEDALTRAVVDAIPADVMATARRDDCAVDEHGGVSCRMPQ
jgi:hypothetical protein